jgi:hypothetical protein
MEWTPANENWASRAVYTSPEWPGVRLCFYLYDQGEGKVQALCTNLHDNFTNSPILPLEEAKQFCEDWVYEYLIMEAIPGRKLLKWIVKKVKKVLDKI